MRTIDYDKIIIPEDRMRREFAPEAIDELGKSIVSKGLMHPPVVKPDGTLVAGERRYRAIGQLREKKQSFRCNGEEFFTEGNTSIPITHLDDLDEYAYMEAELEENLRRVDLSWQEYSQAVKKLQDLREQQHGKYDRATKEGWAVKDTVNEMFGELMANNAKASKVKEDLILADHLEDPDIAKAKTRKEALKLVKKKTKEEHHRKLAESFNVEQVKHTILAGDTLKLAPSLPAARYSVLITDPPYGIGADGFGPMADAKHQYSDDQEYAMNCYGYAALEGYRCTKEQAHAYVFCDIENFPKIKSLFEQAGWSVFSSPLIWNKTPVGMLPLPDRGPRLCYEAILFANKGNRTVTSVQSDVISIPGLQNPMFGAQKPIELYRNLLARSVLPGDEIVDFYAGTGPALFAAEELMCTATVIEMNEVKVDYIKSQLSEKPTAPEPVSEVDNNASLEDLLGELI